MAMVQSPKAATSSSSPSLILTSAPFRGRRRTVVAVSVAARGSSSSSSGDQKSKDDRLLQESGVHRTKLRVPATIVPWKSGSGGGVTAVVDSEVGGRRAISIKRVLQDDDPNTVREFSLSGTCRGDTIFTQSWTPASIKVRNYCVAISGRNNMVCTDRSNNSLEKDRPPRIVLPNGRYSDFAKELNANGFKVYGMDWIEARSVVSDSFQGHGGSDGLHGYVHSLDYAVDDLVCFDLYPQDADGVYVASNESNFAPFPSNILQKSFLDKVLLENPGLPCFCFGHSTGAAIVLKAMMDPKVEARVSGVVLTSPAVGIQPSHPLIVLLAPVISFLLPTFQMNTTNKKGMPVSRDPEALVAKYSDPLVYTGSVRVRTGYEILRITNYLQQNLKRLRVPLLVLHGTADTVTDPDASRKLYEEASSTDKTIKLLEGFLHDLLFEPEREEIMKDITDWLNCRVLTVR
ncbi:unnamed protein product [Dovyalis caffra]|uniref:Serine aminopeptidase S33 domain-containing protein n=1 Tax=Dovyalis caffra TaxID=77055 RepID=A0AAV1QXK5_9ROSI|nr:unnamed protein product [Dovyalis caffra]